MNILLNLLLQLDGIGTNNLLNLLSVLENQESGHSADAVLLSELREFVDVDFEVVCIGILFGEFDDLGCDDLQRLALFKTKQKEIVSTTVR